MAAAKWIECYYGPSGAGKSESIARLIERVFNETGKKARIAVGDGSAATYVPLVEAGVAELADYSIRDWPLSTMSQFCEGYWPEDPENPKSKMVQMTPEKFATIGVYVIEGLAVAGNYIMGDKKGGFAERAARGEKIAGESPVQLIDLERESNGQLKAGSGPGLAFGGVTLGGYGHAQRRLLGFIEKSKALPGYVIWTSHERLAEDKLGGEKIIGPEAAGGALTTSLTKVFNNTLHFTSVMKTAKEEDEFTKKKVDEISMEYRIYTRDHYKAEANIYTRYKAITRGGLTEEQMPTYLVSKEPGTGIIDFYERIAKAREVVRARLLKPAA